MEVKRIFSKMTLGIHNWNSGAPVAGTRYAAIQNFIRWRLTFVAQHQTCFMSTWCLSVRASLHMRREEKPTRCHCMLYCTCDTLNMFRALLYPSSGALDYMYAVTAYGVQCCKGENI